VLYGFSCSLYYREYNDPKTFQTFKDFKGVQIWP